MKSNRAAVGLTVNTHEGAKTFPVKPYEELRRTVLNCLLFEDTFYEGADSIANRIAKLVPQVDPHLVGALAIEAREKFYLRDVTLFLLSELSKLAKTNPGVGQVVELSLEKVIQRADQMGEFLAIYWRGKKDTDKNPLSNPVKRALAAACGKFNEYQYAKYDRDNAYKLRDVFRLVHPKPANAEQSELYRKVVKRELVTPDTWEVALSSGKDKKETFERLLTEHKLGGLAVLRNLRNMVQAGVIEELICTRLLSGIKKAFPYRFVTAAKYAPRLESVIEASMFKALSEVEPLEGQTGILVDISGSMLAPVSSKSETTRLEAACGLAIMLREKTPNALVAAFSTSLFELPVRHGFALRDVITRNAGGGTMLGEALNKLKKLWPLLERLIVVTDEQSADRIPDAWIPKSYIVNVAPYQHGVSTRNGWNHIDGWSERVYDYIREYEKEVD